MIHWYINEAQADYIFKCLGQRPFVEVNSLIADLYNQANPPKEKAPTPYEVAEMMAKEAVAKQQLVPHGQIGSPEAQSNGMAPVATPYQPEYGGPAR